MGYAAHILQKIFVLKSGSVKSFIGNGRGNPLAL
jgi:hypothetical protein